MRKGNQDVKRGPNRVKLQSFLKVDIYNGAMTIIYRVFQQMLQADREFSGERQREERLMSFNSATFSVIFEV